MSTEDTGFSAGQESSAPKKKRFRLKLLVNKRDADGGADSKPKKKKKDKPVKVKSAKAEGPKRRSPLFYLIIGLLLVALGAGIAFLIFGRETVDDQLDKAVRYSVTAEYGKAEDIYDKLLASDPMLAEAYLGLADNHLRQGDTARAIEILTRGKIATEDERIATRLEEIQPEEAAFEEAAPTSLPIVWTDPAFEKMVRLALGQPDGTPIRETDLEHVSMLKIVGGTHAVINSPPDETDDSSLNALNSLSGYTIDGTFYEERGEIRSLADVAHFKNLRKLVISYNQVGDLSAIAGMTSLETLGLYCNEVRDLSALSSLTNIRYLYLYNNEISDLSALSELSELRVLLLQNNQIADLSPLQSSHELVELRIDDNLIESIAPLTGLRNLQLLFAENNAVSDLSPIEGIEALTDISFIGNPATDYSPTSNVQNVNRVY